MSILTRWLGRFHYLHHPHAVACHALLDGISLTLPGYNRYYVAEHPSDEVIYATNFKVLCSPWTV